MKIKGSLIAMSLIIQSLLVAVTGMAQDTGNGGKRLFTQEAIDKAIDNSEVAAGAVESITTESGWTFTISGVGNILVNADNAPDGIKGTADALELRRSFVDLKAEKKLPNGAVAGGKMRMWMEPVFYGNTSYNRPGFGKDDTRLPLELFNEVEAFISNIPLDSKKVHMVSFTGGKGYVAFGFDRPEEQLNFEEFPLIHPLTKAGGLGQEPHARVTYSNKELGLIVDGEIFEATVHDTNLMDIDMPKGEGMSWAARVRKTLPLQFEVMGSYADIKNTDATNTDALAVGLKKTQQVSKTIKLTMIGEYAQRTQHLVNGTDRTTKALHISTQADTKAGAFVVRYGRLNNPLRPGMVNEFGAAYNKTIKQSKDGNQKLDVVGDVTHTRGAIDPAGGTRSNTRATAGVRISFKKLKKTK